MNAQRIGKSWWDMIGKRSVSFLLCLLMLLSFFNGPSMVAYADNPPSDQPEDWEDWEWYQSLLDQQYYKVYRNTQLPFEPYDVSLEKNRSVLAQVIKNSDNTFTLIISGSGIMGQPWQSGVGGNYNGVKVGKYFNAPLGYQKITTLIVKDGVETINSRCLLQLYCVQSATFEGDIAIKESAVTYIGKNSANGFSLTFNGIVDEIGKYAFRCAGCYAGSVSDSPRATVSVLFKEKVYTIGERAFEALGQGCGLDLSVIAMKDVEEIGTAAFKDAGSNCCSFNVDDKINRSYLTDAALSISCTYSSDDFKQFINTRIGYYQTARAALKNIYKSSVSFNFQGTVGYIGDRAFQYVGKCVKSLSINRTYRPQHNYPGIDSARTISSYAFVGKKAEITLRSTMDKIPDGCFFGFGQGSETAKLNLDFPNAKEIGAQAFYQTYKTYYGYQVNLSGNNTNNGAYSNQAVGSDIKDVVTGPITDGLDSLRNNSIGKTRLFDIQWKQADGSYTKVLPASITSFGLEAFYASGYNPGRNLTTVDQYGTNAFDICYKENTLAHVSVDKLQIVDPSTVKETTSNPNSNIQVRIVPADPAKSSSDLRHGELLTFELTNSSDIPNNQLFYKVTIQKGSGSSVEQLIFFDGFDMYENNEGYETDVYISVAEKKYFSVYQGSGNTLTIDVYRASKSNDDAQPFNLERVQTYTTGALGKNDLRKEIDGNSLMLFVGDGGHINKLMGLSGITHVDNSTTCFQISNGTGTNVVSDNTSTDNAVAWINQSGYIKGLSVGRATFQYDVYASNCIYHGTEDIDNVKNTLYVFAAPIVSGNTILLDHRGPIPPVEIPSPTNTSPTNASPTNASPTNASPTNASPTNASPTNASPTNTSPTNTSPTNTSPTNTSPTNTSPTELDWLGRLTDWSVSVGEGDFVPISNTNLFDNLEYATAYRVIYRHRVGGTDANPIYQFLYTTVHTSTPIIHFELNGGTLRGSTSPSDIMSVIVPIGIGRPRNARMIFTGWYYDPSCTQQARVGDKLTEDSVTLYAGWAKRAVSPTISMHDYAVSPTEISDTDILPTLTNQTFEATTISWFYSSNTNTSIPLSEASMSDVLRGLPVGTYYLKANVDATKSYNASSATTLFNVMKRDKASCKVVRSDLTYNGQDQTLLRAQITNNTGSKVRFAVLSNSSSTPQASDWKDGATDSNLDYYVQAKNAGTYYVWYQAMGKMDDPDPLNNTEDGPIRRLEVTIQPKTVEFEWVPAQKKVETMTFTDVNDSDSDGDTTEIIQITSVQFVTSTDASFQKVSASPSDYSFSFIYDGTPKYVMPSLTNIEDGDDCNVEIAMVEPDNGSSNVNVGSFQIVTGTLTDATGDACTNYQLPVATATCIINQREVGLVWSTPTDYKYDSSTNLYSFGHKYVSSTTTNFPKNFVYDTTAKLVTASASNVVPGDTVDVSATLTNLKDNIHAGTFTFVATGLSNANYKLPAATESNVYTIEKDAQFTRTISPSSYVYGHLLSTLPDTPTNIDVQENPEIDWYYSSDGSKINRSWTTQDLQNYSSGKDDAILPWSKASISDLPIGLYYVKAIIHENNNYEQGQSEGTLQILKGKKATPSAITATGDGLVTVDSNDRKKDLEYVLLQTGTPATDTQWKTAVLDDTGSYQLLGLLANTSYTVYLREMEDSNEYASDWVKVDFTTSNSFSVYFDANGGSGTVPDALTAQGGTTVKAPKASDLTKRGYTFDGWNTQSNGNGTDYAIDSDISSGMVLYAKWTAKTYKVVFDANGGVSTMSDMNLTYGVSSTLLPCNFSKKNYQFAGWSTTRNGSVRYADKQDVMNLADGGTITLYAVWAKDLYRVNIIVNSISTSNTNIKLQKGNDDYISPTNIDTSHFDEATGTNVISLYHQTAYTGADYFDNLPSGIYNIVLKQNIRGKDITVTKSVILSNQDVTIVVNMPEGDTSSTLKVKANTPPIVVDGLDREALTKYQTAKSVEVRMTIETQEDKGVSAANTREESLTQSAIAKIKDVAIYGLTPATDTNGKKVKQSKENREFDFANIDVEQIIKTSAGGSSAVDTSPIIETNTLCTIIIPYDMTGKHGIKMYRYHDTKVDILKEVANNNFGSITYQNQEGSFYADKKSGVIYLYASKFSTYAISYVKDQPSSGWGYWFPIESPKTADTGVLLYAGLAITSILGSGIATTKHRRKKIR